MNSKFECFVQIYDQKYDIVINDLGFSVKFSAIYPKVQQIVKIGLNEDITYSTHKFEIFEYMSKSGEGSLANVEQWIRHKSLIRISRKPQQLISCSSLTSSALTPPQSQVLTLSPFQSIGREQNFIIRNSYEIQIYHSIVKAIDIDWVLKNDYHNWDKVCVILRKWKSSDSTKSPHYFRKLFYRWTEYYSKHFYELNGNLSEKSQQIFDLLRVLHILYLDKLFDKNDPIMDRIIDISKDSNSIEFYEKYLKSIRIEKLKTKQMNENIRQTNNNQNLNPILRPLVSSVAPTLVIPKWKHSQNLPTNKSISNDEVLPPSRSRSQTRSQTNSQTPVLKEESQLRLKEEEIKDFYRIVLATNIGWNFRRTDCWLNVSKTINRKQFTAVYCSNKFFFWAKFYAQNYNKLNDKIQSSTQRTFDLLKVVHTLNLHKLYNTSNETALKINDISTKLSFKSYFWRYLKEIQEIKVKSKENETMVSLEAISRRHLTAYQSLLRLDVSERALLRTPHNSISTNFSNKSISTESQIGRTSDPRLKRALERSQTDKQSSNKRRNY